MSLLDEVKAQTGKQGKLQPVTPDEIELVIAWLRREVTLAQISRATKKNQTYIGYRLAAVCRAALDQGKLTINP